MITYRFKLERKRNWELSNTQTIVMKDILIITSLMCEAAPLIEAWGLKPVRESEIDARFQAFNSNGVYLAVSGIGKLRSAVTTAALMAHIQKERGIPLVANIGIAGGSPTHTPRGTLALINKVRDVATNTRSYPDIILKHSAKELPLDTHDHPVTTPFDTPVLVDMEGAGFMQAATTLAPPSAIVILKVVSDYCDNTPVTPTDASNLIQANINSIYTIIEAMRTGLPEVPELSLTEQDLVDQVARHAKLSLSQRLELHRQVRARKAQDEPFTNDLERVLTIQIANKDQRRVAYEALIRDLTAKSLP